MSEKPPPKKARVARGKSDVKYLGAHGLTNKFQAQWLEHPAPEGQPPPLLKGLHGSKGEQQQIGRAHV